MQELDIRVIFSVLLSKIKWIILAVVVFAMAFGAYAKFFIPSTYRSQVQMYVSNYTDLSTAPGASSSGLTASQQLVNEYIVILKNDALLTRVADQLREQGSGYVMTPAAIRSASTMSSVNETAMLNIAVTTTDPEMSKAICDAYSAVAPELLKEVMEMGTVKRMEPAKIGSKVGPNVTRNASLGGVIGLLISCSIVLVLCLFDNTVSGERGIKQRLDIAVLGEVPNLEPMKKGVKKSVKNKN